MKGARDIFAFLVARKAAGERVALVTVTAVIGSSSRAIGTHMAVSESGLSAGSLSGGCVEAAVIAEAQRLIEADQPEIVRFGDGSRYIDIRLPCGGGVDLAIVPVADLTPIQRAMALLDDRQRVALTIDAKMNVSALQALSETISGWSSGIFTAPHSPDLRIVIVGHGEEVRALAASASTYGATPTILSPDRDIVELVTTSGMEAHLLNTTNTSPHLIADRWTAIVFLFHDHDWEADLMGQALQSEAFFIGAMGSRRTHEIRLESLAALGISAESRAKITAPLGLIPSSRDPDTLALSTMAQIVSELHQQANRQRNDSIAASIKA